MNFDIECKFHFIHSSEWNDKDRAMFWEKQRQTQCCLCFSALLDVFFGGMGSGLYMPGKRAKADYPPLFFAMYCLTDVPSYPQHHSVNFSHLKAEFSMFQLKCIMGPPSQGYFLGLRLTLRWLLKGNTASTT